MAKEPQKRRSEVRNKTDILHVRCLPEEREEIQKKAAQFGVSVSAYMRNAALKYKMVSVTDQAMLDELLRLGRLQKHLFVEGKRTGDKEYSEVLSGINGVVAMLRNSLRQE